MKKLTFTELINGYAKSDNSEMPFFSRNFSGNLSGSRKKSKILSVIASFGEKMAYTSMRTYGVMLLVFGVLTILIQFIKSSFLTAGEHVYSTLIIGASFALLSTVFIAFDKPMATALQEWTVSDYILFGFFRIRRMYRRDDIPGLHPAIAIFVALIPAAIGYFVPAYVVASIIGIVVFAYMAMISPEFSFFTTLMMLPFLPIIPYGNAVMCALAFITALSFWIKVLHGKRFYRLEQYDLILFALALVVLISGLFIGGANTLRSSAIVVSAVLLFTVASNAITNRNLAECAISAISLSSLPVSIITIVDFAKAASVGIDFENFEIKSTFTSTSSFGAFCAAAVICSVVMAKCREKTASAAIFIIVALLSIAALGFALRIDVLLLLILSVALIKETKKNRNAIFLTFLVYIFMHIPLLIPKNILSVVTVPLGIDTAFSERIEVLKISFSAFLENPFFGSGINSNTLATLTEKLLGTAHESSDNLLMEFVIRIGAIATGLFVILMLVRFRHVRRYAIYIASDTASYYCYGTSAFIFLTLTLGIYGYVFKDASVFCLFFAMFGIGSSMLRVAKRDYDEKQGYFADEKSTDFSAVDISLTK